MSAGSAGTLSNSQCTLTAAGFSNTASGAGLTLTVPVTFAPSFAGEKTVYTKATDRSGLGSAFLKAGAWTASPLNPQLDVVTSACGDASADAAFTLQQVNELGGAVTGLFTLPNCFRSYGNYLPQEGYFLDGDRRPLPIMGRTCGHFDVLFVFVDNDFNRQQLLANTSIPSAVKTKLSAGRLQEGLTDLLASYTTADLFSGFVTRALVAKAVSFTLSAAVTNLSSSDLTLVDGGLGFANYDAVVVINDLRPNAAHGVERWPGNLTRPLFYGRNGTFFLHIDPFWLQPALFAHELLQRNVPVLLREHRLGDQLLVNIGGTIYDQTPIINPRTGENIEPLIRATEGKIPLVDYIAGFADVDGDGIPDCIDPFITPTADNVDGDFIPDRYDPDLHFDHRPYSWMYADRAGR